MSVDLSTPEVSSQEAGVYRLYPSPSDRSMNEEGFHNKGQVKIYHHRDPRLGQFREIAADNGS